MRPLFYLDIDGVINMVRMTRPWDVPVDYWREMRVAGHTIRWDSRVVDAINRWHFTGLAEVMWLTTWEELAPTVFAPALGLAHFGLPETSSQALPGRELNQVVTDWRWPWWKYDSVHHHTRSNWLDDRPVVWVDDDLDCGLRTDPLLAWWANDRWNRGLRTLLITPDPRYGLTQDLLRTIGLFLNGRGNDFSVMTYE